MKGLTKIIIILFVGFGTSIMLYTFIIAPLLSEVNIINADVRTKKMELSVLQKQITAFKTAQADLAKATRKDDVIKAILEREDLVEAVLDLERSSLNTTSVHQLEIKEVVINPKDRKAVASQISVISKKTGIDEVPYEVSVTNDFMGMVNFINYLEHLPHFTEISKINLSSEQDKSLLGDINRSGRVAGIINGVFFVKQKK
jgi:Tfp pilus assembly protein PilO